MSLKETLSAYWVHVQEELLPWLNDTTCGPLNEHHKQLVSVLGMARIEAFLPGWPGRPGLLGQVDRSTIPGDLNEEFLEVILPRFGRRRAALWYWMRAFSAIAWRNPLCRWALIGGGAARGDEWLWKIRS